MDRIQREAQGRVYLSFFWSVKCKVHPKSHYDINIEFPNSAPLLFRTLDPTLTCDSD